MKLKQVVRLRWMYLAVATAPALVRAAAPPDRYTFPSAGVVYDTRTKLTWQQEVVSNSYTQEEATAYCASLSLAGAAWRLPAVSELLTLVDLTQENPAIDTKAFPNTPPAGFWTSSVYGDANAWTVNFLEGKSGGSGTAAKGRARCVR